MKRTSLPWVLLALVFFPVLSAFAQSQQQSSPGITAVSTTQATPSSVIAFSDSLPGQADGDITATFALYPDAQSTTPAWTETQVVQFAQGKYSVLLGSATAGGIPADIFAADQAHWLGVQINGTEKRFLLVSVPFAMKAMEAEKLGGLLPSQFVTTAQLQAALQAAATSGSSTTTSGGTKTTSGPVANASLNPPEPATDFTDNNTTEVLLVTQQGTGFAIHAISAGDAALFAENSTPTGTAVKALASSTSGTTIGLLAQSASPNGIAGVIDNTGNGQILSLRNNGNEVASVDNAGNFKASQISANVFFGNGGGLFNIPPFAVGAQTGNVPGSIVVRDGSGSFSAGQVSANLFFGNGAGLFNIPPFAVGAQTGNVPGSIVVRDESGSFSAGQVSANLFFGNGAGLFNIPPFAVGAQTGNVPGSIVVRDGSGSFSAGQVSANLFFGNGAGLFNIPPFAVGAQTGNVPGSIVVRDASGNFSAGLISANSIFSAGPITGFNISATGTQGVPAIHGSADGGFGIQASTQYGYGLWAEATSTQTVGTALVLTHASGGKLISGGTGAFPLLNSETFSVDGSGNITFNGGLMQPYQTGGAWAAGSLVKLTSNQGTLGQGTVVMTSPGDTSGVIGIITGVPPGSSMTEIASSGQSRCNFDGNAAPNIGDYVGISKTTAGDCADIGPNYPNDGQQVIGRVVSSFGIVLLFDAELHGGAGGGVTINTGAGLTGGPITQSGTISIPNGGVTNAMLAANAVTSANLAPNAVTSTSLAPNAVTSANLAPNAVTSASLAPNAVTAANIANGSVTNAQLAAGAVTSINVADGALTPAKIAGTAATLGFNNFAGIQSIVGGLNLDGDFHFQGQNNSSIYLRSLSGVAIQIDQSNTGPAGVGIAIRSDYDSIDASSNFGPAVNAFGSTSGVFARGTTGVTAQGFSVGLSATSLDQSGTGTAAVFSNLAPGKILSALLDSTEVFNVDTSGNLMANGAVYTKFPDSGTVLNGPVKLQNGAARATIGADTQGGVIGIAISSPDSNGNVAVAYSGVANCGFDGVNGLPQPGDLAGISHGLRGACTDLGLSPPPGAQVLGRILLPANKQLSILAPVLLVSTQGDNDPTVSINTGAGLTGGPISSTGTISIANAGVANSMLQNSSVTVNPGSGLTGGGTIPLGGSVTLSNAGALSFNGRTGNVVPAAGDYSFSQLNGAVSPFQLPIDVAYIDRNNSFSVDQTINGNMTTNSLATGSLTSTAASIAGSSSGQTSVLSVTDNGAANNAAALSVSSVNNQAAFFFSVGPNILSAGTATHNVLGVTSSGMSVLGTVSATTFSGDGSGLSNVNASSIGGTTLANLAMSSALTSEATARQSADAALATSISAETTARQTDTSNLQTSINNVSAADAKLATANTFTASNTFTGGTQDFSAAGATLPVRALPSAQTPATCVASKELLIKTDAPAGQQLFVCGAGGTTWNLVGDGASGGVTSFNGRNGTVSSNSGDYSFNQISGSVATAQLPANVVYNNQANTFGSNQTVNGNLTATSFTGNGGGLTNVNAAALNGLASSSFAQLSASTNTFTGAVTAASFSGNGSALSNVNAATVNSLQMLKLTASITPASVNHQTCSEQSFTVSGVNSGDVLLSVQLSSHSPGTNIAVGGWRVSASNTVAIQFCNVGSGNNTPTAGTYTFALMR